MNAPTPHVNEQIANVDDLKLFQPGKIGSIEVKNRVVMAPLTRCRSDEAAGDIPGSDMNIEYYKQRANAGLIISEGTQWSSVSSSRCLATNWNPAPIAPRSSMSHTTGHSETGVPA